jgi:hypothetical protein
VELSVEDAPKRYGEVKTESVLIGLVALIFAILPSRSRHFWVFELALLGVFLSLLFRVMAGKADNPNMSAIKRSLSLSSVLIQIALLGVLSSLSLLANSYMGILSPAIWFAILGFGLPISVALIDVLWLDEYTDTWVDIVYQQTTDGPAGQVIRAAVDYGKERIDSFKNNEVTFTLRENVRAVLLAVVLLSLLAIVTIPVWLLIGGVLRDLVTAVFVVVSLLLLRDMVRYVYLRYGAAQAFEDLNLSLRWGLTLTALKAVMVVAALGYDLTTFIQ